MRRVAVLAAVLAWGLAGCATKVADGEFELRGVVLDASMTVVELRRALPELTCLEANADGAEVCVMSSGADAMGVLAVSLFNGRVGSIVLQVGAEEFDSLARHIVSQLGDGEEVRGKAGIEGRQDQVVVTWAQDRRFVRLVKREPFDLSRSALIALSKAMDAHLGRKPEAETTVGRCLTHVYGCPPV